MMLIVENMRMDKIMSLHIGEQMSVAELRRSAETAPSTVTRMKQNQEVTLRVLGKIYKVLQVDFDDVVKHIPGKTEELNYNSEIEER